MNGWRRCEIHVYNGIVGFPGGSGIKNPPANAGDAGLIPGSGRSLWSGKGQPTPVFLPGKSHRQRRLVELQSVGSQRVGQGWAHSTTNGILLSHKKEWNSAICNNMDGLESLTLNEISQRKTISCYHLHVEFKKINTHITKQMHRYSGGRTGEEGDGAINSCV